MLYNDESVDVILANLGPYITETLLNFLMVIVFMMLIFLLAKSFLKFNLIKQQCNKHKYLDKILIFFIGTLASSGSFWYIDYPSWAYIFFVVIFLTLGFSLGSKLGFWFVLGSTPIIIYNAMSIYGVNIGVIDSGEIYQLLIFSILYGEIIIFMFAHFWIKNKSNFVYFIYNLIIFSVLLGIVLPIVFTQPITKLSLFSSISISVDLVMTILTSFLGFGLVKFIDKFIYKTEKLGINVSYKNGFINNKFANSQIDNFIDQNKINFAYIVKFSILGIDRLISSYGYGAANKIKIQMIRQAQEQLNSYNGLFYMQGDDSEYFAILPIKNIKNIDLKIMKKGNTLKMRESDDDLNFLEKILKNINDENNKILDSEFMFNLFAHTMIYGVTSNNYLEINTTLENINLMYSSYNENSVVLIDTNISPRKEYNQKNKALEQFNKFGPNDITINIHPRKEKYGSLKLFESDAALLKEFLLSKQEIYQLAKNESVQSAIICHVSAKSIKTFVQQKLNKNKNVLIVDYPQYLLEQIDFNIYELISNITSYEILPSQIVLNILINRQTFTNIFYENLFNLEKENLKIAFTNLTNNNDTKIKKLNPLYL